MQYFGDFFFQTSLGTVGSSGAREIHEKEEEMTQRRHLEFQNKFIFSEKMSEKEKMSAEEKRAERRKRAMLGPLPETFLRIPCKLPITPPPPLKMHLDVQYAPQ